MSRAVLAAFLVVGSVFAGETGRVAGRVVDKLTGEPLPQASVVVVGTGLGTAADNEGFFVILGLRPGRYAVEGSMIGFQTVRVTDVLVQADRTARTDFRLEEAAIEMPKVMVKAERPMVSKEMVAPQYAIRAEEMIHLPGDRLPEVVFFAPSVVKTESTFHVRGGRAAEVDYLVDGVSVLDPFNGELGIEVAKGVADEVIFLPGGFSAEYGRVMSGVINMVTVNPRSSLGAGYRVKSEKPMPMYYDFGYSDHGLQFHLPAGRNLRSVFDVGLTATDDWDPRLFWLPHKARQDYSLYGKAFYDIAGKVKVALSGVASRTQLDRYDSEWKLLLDDFRSDLRKGNLGVAKVTYMPDARALYGLTVSRFSTEKTYGLKEPGQVSFWKDFQFRDTSEYESPGMDMDNPWGCPYENYWYFYTFGTYEDFRRTSSTVLSAKLAGSNQVTNSHLIAAGVSADLYSVANERVRWPAYHPVVDTYRVGPHNLGCYVQDKIEYEGLYANLGLRFDRFDPRDSVRADSGAPEACRKVQAKSQFSPRLGVSFRITDWLFARANYGYYFQVPQLSWLYDNTRNPVRYRTVYGDSMKIVVGNPQLKPERTQAYELGLQGEVSRNVLLTTNLWLKDVKDLVGTREFPARPQSYVTYVNIDHAQLTGIEFILDLRQDWAAAKVSYTYSRARGSSSYANEGYDRFLSQGDSAVPAVEYTLDFDQPHRAFVQIDMKVPDKPTGRAWLDAALDDAALYVLGYVGTGLPYTPPGGKEVPETRNTFQRPIRSNVDALVTKGFRLGNVKLDLVAEVLNVLDIREVLYVYPRTGLPNDDGVRPDYNDFQRSGPLAIRYGDPQYHPRRDFNLDGFLSQYEEYRSTCLYHQATVDWPNNYGPPRRARLGIELNW